MRAKWVPLQTAHTLTLDRTNKGSTLIDKAPGYAEFEMGGQVARLYPTLNGTTLFFVFRDLTSRTTTYPAGRFLYVDTEHDFPKGFDLTKPTELILNFNLAINPECAYNMFTTCPIAPPENRLPFEVPAGEKRYSDAP